MKLIEKIYSKRQNEEVISKYEIFKSSADRRIEGMEKEYRKLIWVCVFPDNGHWNEKFAQKEVDRIAKKWSIQAVATLQTRDRWYGQERLFAVSGETENIEAFESELNEALY